MPPQDAGVKGVTFVPCDFSVMADAAELGRKLQPADVTLLTHGIVPGNTREVTADGIERDMAVSTLSRLVVLRELLPRLQPGARVFVWGMPGNGMTFKNGCSDLNSEKEFEKGFGITHAQTVGANEALVLHLAARERTRASGIALFGVNPGLVSTGIRDAIHGGSGSWLGSCLEGAISLFTPSAAKYADTMLPVLFAPGLEAHSGTMFGQNGGAIKPNLEFDPPGRATEWYDAMEALLKRTANI